MGEAVDAETGGVETGSVALVIGTGTLELGIEVGSGVEELVTLGMLLPCVGPLDSVDGMLKLCVGPVAGGVEAEAVVTPVLGPERVGIGALDSLPVGIGALELAEVTVGKIVKPKPLEGEVGSVAFATAELLGRMALVISEIIPPKPLPVEEAGVGTAEDAADVASVALAVGTGTMAELVGGRMALVMSEMMPPKPPPVEEAVGTGEDTPEVTSAADDTTEVTPVGAEDTAEVTSVAFAVGAGAMAELVGGRMALVISEIIPPKMPDAEVVGTAVVTAEDAAEVTSLAAEETTEVTPVAVDETAEVASVALAVGAGRRALVTPDTTSPRLLVKPGIKPPPVELAAGELTTGALEVGVTMPVGAITMPLEEAAIVWLAALEEAPAAEEAAVDVPAAVVLAAVVSTTVVLAADVSGAEVPLGAVETTESAALVDELDPRPMFSKLDGKTMRGDPAEDPAALDSVFPVGLGVDTTPVIVVEGDTNTGVVRVMVWLSLSLALEPELEGSFFDDPRPLDKLAMRSPRLSESRFVVSDVSDFVLSGVEAAEGALVMVMLVNCRFTCRGK
jgi:hypothetical protein